MLMLIFCSYSAGISLFSHTHIINGASVVHSHLGGGSNHEHTESQYTVIEILSHFQSEYAVSFHSVGVPFILLSESCTAYDAPSYMNEVHAVQTLRGPPQA